MSVKVEKILVAVLSAIRSGDDTFVSLLKQMLKGIEASETIAIFEGSGQYDLAVALEGKQAVFLIDHCNLSPGSSALELSPEDLLYEDALSLQHHTEIRQALAITHIKECAPHDVKVFGIPAVTPDMGPDAANAIRIQIHSIIDRIVEKIRGNHF